MTEIKRTLADAKKEIEPSTILLFTQHEDLMEDVSKNLDNEDLIIFTQKPVISSFLGKSNVKIRNIKNSPRIGLDVLDQVKDLVLSCSMEGLIDKDEKILVVVSTDIETLISIDMKDLGIANLKDEVEDRIQTEVLENAFNLGTKIVREGKEGFPAGALFIMGDMNNVLNHSKEAVKNPLEGCAEEEYNIKSQDKWNTVKEFSMIDGALVLDKFGNPVAAGRYVMFGNNFESGLEDGLGGRHLAAAYISEKTKAIAMVVSSEGTIRIYKNGNKIYEVEVV